jgi:hypothetical protein
MLTSKLGILLKLKDGPLALTARGLAKLVRRAHLADAEMTEAITFHSKSHGETLQWGQFIDAKAKNAQVGIFGTAAAAAILADSASPEFVTMSRSALIALPGWSGSSPDCLDEPDLGITLKCTAILDARPHEHSAEANQEKVENQLVQFKAGKGWGYFLYNSRVPRDPHILPTAQVLVSLANSPTFQSKHHRKWKDAVEWLIDALVHRPELSALECAFGLLALERNRSDAGSFPRFDDARRACLNGLQIFCGKRPPELVAYYHHIHYVAPVPAPPGTPKAVEVDPRSHLNRYMFYPVDVIVAIALLATLRPKKTGLHPEFRRYITRVVSTLLDQLKNSRSKAYESAATGRATTIDAYWVHVLLKELQEKYRAGERPLLPWWTRLFAGRRAWIVSLVVLAALTAIGSAAATYLPPENPWKATLAFLVGLVLLVAAFVSLPLRPGRPPES